MLKVFFFSGFYFGREWVRGWIAEGLGVACLIAFCPLDGTRTVVLNFLVQQARWSSSHCSAGQIWLLDPT